MMSPGGVCAVLDYDMDQMTEYVAEMTQRLLPTADTTLSSLREFVMGLLSSTRLPSTTILLGLQYLAKRVNMSNAAINPSVSEKEVMGMLTVGLLLASKFLDDNTFQNRSWAEVSGVPVEDLNNLETEWLLAMNYCIYVNLDKNIDYKAWLSNWIHWCKVNNRHNRITLDLLAPLIPLDDYSQRMQTNSQTYGFQQKPVNTIVPPPGFKHNYSKNIWSQSYPTPPYLTPPYLTPPYLCSKNTHYYQGKYCMTCINDRSIRCENLYTTPNFDMIYPPNPKIYMVNML